MREYKSKRDKTLKLISLILIVILQIALVISTYQRDKQIKAVIRTLEAQPQ